jgi:hypothetical protein
MQKGVLNESHTPSLWKVRPPMTAKLRPLVESLEGRVVKSAGSATAAAPAVFLSFVASGTRTSGVHALASQQASSVTLTLHRSNAIDNVTYNGPVQVEVTTPGSTVPA